MPTSAVLANSFRSELISYEWPPHSSLASANRRICPSFARLKPLIRRHSLLCGTVRICESVPERATKSGSQTAPDAEHKSTVVGENASPQKFAFFFSFLAMGSHRGVVHLEFPSPTGFFR